MTRRDAALVFLLLLGASTLAVADQRLPPSGRPTGVEEAMNAALAPLEVEGRAVRRSSGDEAGSVRVWCELRPARFGEHWLRVHPLRARARLQE